MIKVQKKLLQQAKNLISSPPFCLNNQDYDFNSARRACFNSPELKELITRSGIDQIYEISSGTSERMANPILIRQAAKDILDANYYRDYVTTRGNLEARSALSIYESIRSNVDYQINDICLANGSTGAISAVIEYVSAKFKTCEVIIATPNYYLYKLAAKYFGLNFNEVLTISKNNRSSLRPIIDAINIKTKLIVITNPTNPTGEIYSSVELQTLIQIARERNILLLIDELFAELVFDQKQFSYIDSLVSKPSHLNNLAIIRGFSKSKNLAAFRIGYLLSKNEELMKSVTRSIEVQTCFSAGANYTGTIVLSAFIDSVIWIYKKSLGSSVASLVREFKKEFGFSPAISLCTCSDLIKKVENSIEYTKKLMDYYVYCRKKSYDALSSSIDVKIQNQAAFNSFVKLRGLEGVNIFDFTLNLYLTTGVKLEAGPCFGFPQKTWESDPRLGFYTRITYTPQAKNMVQGIRLLQEFIRIYCLDPSTFISTGLSFN